MVRQKKEGRGEKVRNVNDLVNIQQKYLVIGSKKNNRVRRKRKWVKENKILSIVRLEFLRCIKGDGRTDGRHINEYE